VLLWFYLAQSCSIFFSPLAEVSIDVLFIEEISLLYHFIDTDTLADSL
jgi:hypothetical protein